MSAGQDRHDNGDPLGNWQFPGKHQAPPGRHAAMQLLRAIEADDNFEVIPITQELYAEALNLFGSRVEKDWGLIDCASFVVMSARGLSDALTADQHFEQAGFRALLRTSD